MWFTGLSGCGKSTVSNLVDHKLHQRGLRSFVLDGDNVRHGLNAGPGMLKEKHGEEFAKRFGLGFSAQDREENIRRIGAVAELFSSAGIITLTACYFGLNTQGGTEGVGTAATRAVVACSVLILATDYFLTQLLLVVLNPN